MPKIRADCYENTEQPRFDVKEHQEMELVKGLIHDEEACNEFLTNVLIYITGVVKLDKMNQSDDTSGNNEKVVTSSDEAYEFLLL